MKRVRIFTDRYPFLGPLIYMLSVQYFVVQLIVAAAWKTPYSWANNVISDLGNTACGQYGTRYVCSPDYVLMNASFILLGLIMAIGSLLIYHEFKQSRLSFIAFSLMGLGGVGTVLVGLFPENTIGALHAVGAFMAFGFGNLSLVLLAVALKQARGGFRLYTFISGVVSLTAFALFIGHIYLGLGEGGMERIISYPQTAWLIFFGSYMTATRVRARRS